MKVKLSLAAIVVVGFIVLGACNTTSSVGSSSSPAYNSGQLFGSSLLSLYSDYKQAGKIDMSNTFQQRFLHEFCGRSCARFATECYSE